MPNHKKNDKDREKTKPYKVPATKKKTVAKSGTETTNKQVPTARAKQANKKKKQHPKLMMTFKIMIIAFLLLCVIGAGVVAAMFFGLFGDDFEISKEELVIGASNSVVVDKDGNVIANLSGDEKRKVISLEDMSDYLPKAYIAIEDKRFYDHSGVDAKRTAGAILGTFTGSDNGGGSTITQQLVKNITNDKAASGLEGIMRKVREWAKAYQVERMISKDQILELYLNILFVGGDNIHGVELGAGYYFNKSAKDLDLAESAFLAGINHSPNMYNPYNEEKDQEKVKELTRKRTLTVLQEMKDQGYVTNEEEYQAAVAKVEAGFQFQKGAMSSGTVYSYHTDAAVKQVIAQVMEEKNISEELAKNYVYSSGLTIYSTQDSTIQARVEEETKKTKYIKSGREKEKDGTLKNEHTQAAMIIIDHKTGNVVGVSGGLGEKTGSTLNRATQSKRQPGSSIKPIAVIAPALQEKVITAATVYDDVLTDFNGYQPKNDGHKYRGFINIREIIAYSQNVPEVKIMRELTPSKSIDYLREFGVTSLYKNGENKDHDDESLPLGIGGISDGISPLEMAAAYATIANNGEYITPTFFTKVVDSNGNTVLTAKQEKRRVISEQNAYLTRSILQEPVRLRDGTATYCAIKGMEVSAKTGTTDESKDRWLCGMTPYYAAACWFGYDSPEEVVFSGYNPAGQIWSSVMKSIHTNLANATFTKPSGIVEATVCKTTGCLATSSCTNTYKELFTSDNMPTKCEGHGTQNICQVSGKIANEYCPADQVKATSYGGNIPKEQLKLWKPVNGSTSSAKDKITEVCDKHKKTEEKPKEPEKPANTTNKTNNTNNTNTAGNTNTNTPNGNTNTNVPNGNTNTPSGNTNIPSGNTSTKP